MIGENRTKKKLSTGEVVFGVFVPIASARIVEVCSFAGFDYVVLDAEHGPLDVGACEDLVRAAELTGMTAIVRVPDHNESTILRFLDIGAQGIMAPHVNSATEARQIVQAVKYGPLGSRGLGQGRAAHYGQSMSRSEYAAIANKETMIIAQMEDVKVLSELSELLTISEIDAFELGLNDLSQSMGFPGQTKRAEVQAVVSKIVAEILGAGRILGDTANDIEGVRALMEKGCRMIDCGFISVATTALKRLVAEGKKAKTRPDR